MSEPVEALKIFRLETRVEMSVSKSGIQVQTVKADFFSIADYEGIRSHLQAVGLSAKQIGYALERLKEIQINDGFLIPLDQEQS